MVNEEKLKDMIELARYEESEGRKNYIINSYFEFDYVEKHMLAGLVAYTVCFMMVFSLIVIYRFDEVMTETNILSILAMFKPYLGYYAAGLLVYELIIMIVNIIRYSIGKKAIKMNSSELRRFGRRFYSDKEQ
ncbi:MAG: hypothetical protein Q4E54_00265 [Lachnospiraceae bacterium]|nr:hypothetical protein [Lachnospiraceae bacterium]